nr:Ferric iron ABC transporter [Raoultella sp. NCTC 9187]
MHARGWLLAYQSANADKVPANLKSADYVAQGISALGIVWNSKSGTPEPKEWRDLTEAAFKDKVTTPDPALSGASLDLLIGLQSGMGDKAWALFDALKKNGMVVSGPNAQAVTPVMQGAKAAVFGAVDYVSYGNISQGESLKVIFPASGTVIAPRPMMILKTTPHADDAKAFVDYVLSPEGQAMVADAWLMPARSDVPAKRPLLNELKVLPTSGDGSSERRAGAGPLQHALRAVICLPLAAGGGDPRLQENTVNQKLISGATLAALLVLVALPLFFIVLQAIFPHFSAGSLSGAFSGRRDAVCRSAAAGNARRHPVDRRRRGAGQRRHRAPARRAARAVQSAAAAPVGPAVLNSFSHAAYIAALSWMLVLQSNGYLQQLTGWDLNDLLFSRSGIVLVMALNIFPVVYFAVSRSLLASGQRLAIVARVHGASAWRAFWHITLPMLSPALAAGMLLAFTLAIEEYGVPAALGSRAGVVMLTVGIEKKLADWPIDLNGASLLSLLLIVVALLAWCCSAGWWGIKK